jgi:hypothetical protein
LLIAGWLLWNPSIIKFATNRLMTMILNMGALYGGWC